MSGRTSPEVTTSVLEVLAWLPRVLPETVVRVLVGCGFHDGNRETLDLKTVEAADVVRATITLGGVAAPVSLRRCRDGEFVDTRPGAPLAAAIAGSRTPLELQDEVERRAVRQAGFDPGKLPSREALRAVLVVVEMDAAGRPSDEAQRMAFYQAVRAGSEAATARVAVRLLRSAQQRFEARGHMPESLHWQLAALLRQAGDWQAAVQAASVLYSRARLGARTQLYLASTMTASLLELAAVRPSSQLLAEAERALKIAWSLDPGDDELRKMWRTLDKLRG